MKKGFGQVTAPKQEFVEFLLELKTRMIRDNSELLVGTVKLKVPKLKNRQYERAIAISATTHYLIIGKAPKSVNQIFVFTHRGDFVDRIELLPWSDDDSCQKTELSDEQQSLAAIAYNSCQFEENILPRPVVA